MKILLLAIPAALFAQTLELYPNFETIGVTVDLQGLDSNFNASATLWISRSGQPYSPGFSLDRVGQNFIGSIFWCEEGQEVDVEVRMVDPDGGVLNGLTLSGSATTLTTPSFPAALRELWVSPSGTGNTCSNAIPCSVETAVASAQAGDHIIFNEGVYYSGDLSFNQSGTANNPIVLKAAVGASPILDGSIPGVLPFSSLGNQAYRFAVTSNDTNCVVVEGERLYPYQTQTDFDTLSWGLSGFLPDESPTNQLDIHFLNPTDPNGLDIRISRFNSAFALTRDYIHVEGLTFRYYGASSYGKAIYINDSSNHIIRNCTFIHNDLGIGLKRAAHRNLIEGCWFEDSTFMWPWDAVKAGSQLETGGVSFYSPTTGRGNVIRRNHFENYFDGFTSCPEDNGSLTNETDVYENTVRLAGDDGLSADGSCSNVRVWNNTFSDVLVGISLAPVLEGPIYCVRNLIFRTGQGNSSYTGYPFKFNVGSQPTSGVSYLFHNTSVAVVDGQNGFWIKTPGTWDNIVSRNNIWVGTEHALNNGNTSQPLDMDYDLMWHDGSASFARWGSSQYVDLAAFIAATNQNPNGFQFDPQFVNPTAGNFHLSAGSAALDAAVIIPGINDHLSAPDLGALERLSMPPFDIWLAQLGEPEYQAAMDSNSDGKINILDYI